jgi:hypothetical protein
MFTPTGGSQYQRWWLAHVNIPGVSPGDYNCNGIVDAADYTVWRDHLGQNYSLQNRDPGASGPISQSDYDYWVAHFGQSGSGAASSGTQVAVPEPGTTLLAITALVGASLTLRRGEAQWHG